MVSNNSHFKNRTVARGCRASYHKLDMQESIRGSITLESTVALTMFLFFFMTVFSIVNICRAQAIISMAVDQTAKEMSQYAYFYKMSGMQKLDEKINAASTEGRESLNGVIGGFDSLYGMIESLDGVKNEVSANVVGSGDIISTALESAGGDLNAAINQLEPVFSAAMDNPMEFMKTLAAFAGQQCLDVVKSRLIAAPLAKAMSIKYFGKTKEEAQARLESMGVVDGVDGLNFKLSTVFSSMAPEDVQVTCLYQIQVIKLMGLDTKVTFSKTANTRGWMSGDQDEATRKQETAKTEPRADNEMNIWASDAMGRGKYIVSTERARFSDGTLPAITSGMDGYNPTLNEFTTINTIDPYASSYLEDSAIRSKMKGYAGKLISSTGQLSSVVVEDPSAADGKTTYSVSEAGKKYKLLVVIPENADKARMEKILTDVVSSYPNGSVIFEVVQGYGNSPNAP